MEFSIGVGTTYLPLASLYLVSSVINSGFCVVKLERVFQSQSAAASKCSDLLLLNPASDEHRPIGRKLTHVTGLEHPAAVA